MNKRQNISNLSNGESVNSIYLVKYIAIAEGRDGRSYLNLILSDATGDIECRKWQGAEEVITEVERGCFVNVIGRINQYQNRFQLIVKDICKVSEQDAGDLQTYIPKSDKKNAEYSIYSFRIIISKIYISVVVIYN